MGSRWHPKQETRAGGWSSSRSYDVNVLQAVQWGAEECCWCLTFLPPSLFSLSFSHMLCTPWFSLAPSHSFFKFVFLVMVNLAIAGTLSCSVLHCDHILLQPCNTNSFPYGSIARYRVLLNWWPEEGLRFTHSAVRVCHMFMCWSRWQYLYCLPA